MQGRATVLAGGAGGLFRLQRPLGRREVAETIGLRPASGGDGSLGPRFYRFGFQTATARRRRRRRGGISPSGLFLASSALRSGTGGESMEEGLHLWSPGVRRRRLVITVVCGRRLLACRMLRFGVGEAATVYVAARLVDLFLVLSAVWRVQQIRAWVSVGRVPGRWSSFVFVSSLAAGFVCCSVQSLLCDGAPLVRAAALVKLFRRPVRWWCSATGGNIGGHGGPGGLLYN